MPRKTGEGQNVWFLKSPAAFQAYQKWYIDGQSGNICRLAVTTCMFFLLVLLVFGIPTAIVIFKFILNHCGDLFETEEQFHVTFEANEFGNDSGDEFDVNP